MESCIYRGETVHRRREPFAHEFRYPLFYLWLDLGELDQVFRGRWLWSARRPALARFRREDHFGPADQPLDEAAKDLVERETGRRPAGPVRLLTHPRFYGFVFNPISMFFCCAADGRGVEAIIAEVGNTPWGERHLYVLDAAGADAPFMTFRNAKAFHVSPFMGMEQIYHWRVGRPGDRFSARLESREDGRPIFDAALSMRRVEITGLNLAKTLLRFPFMTASVMAGIYWQALRLWMKGAKFFPHPKTNHAKGEAIRS